MKIAIFYFTGTGNTWWVMNELQQQLKDKGHEVSHHSYESEFVKDKEKVKELINKSDLIGIGYPIYGSDIPPVFMEFVDTLPKMENKLAFVFTTMMIFSGDGALVAKRRLKRRGYKVRQAVNIRMPNNVKLPYPIFSWFPIRNEEENDGVKRKAKIKITKLVEKIDSGKKWLQGWDPFNIAGGLMQRIEMRLFDLSVYARNYFVDEESCTECMTCVESCPTNNIVFKEGVFTWEDRCTLCLRCYHFCPEDAIQFKKGTLDREKYTRYKGPGDGFSYKKLK